MRITARIVLAFAVCNFAAAGDADALVSASASAPIRAGIDSACSAGALAAAAKTPVKGRVVWLERTGTRAAGSLAPTYGAWHIVAATGQPPAEAALTKQSVAAVVSRHVLTYVRDVTSDASGDGATEHEYCYLAGKLARAKIALDDVSEDLVYMRVIYYDPSGAPLADSGQQTKKLSASAKPQRLPASSLAIPLYAKAEQQPFYPVLQHALAP